MIAGADDRTCIHENTTHVIYLIFGLPDMSMSIEDVADQIKANALRLAPTAEVDFAIY